MPEKKGADDDGREVIEKLQRHYRTGRNNLGEEFFVPCLRYCQSYDRAVGYFSSSALSEWAEVLPRIAGLEELKIRLLISPQLSVGDKAALGSVVDAEARAALQKKVVERVVEEAIRFSENPENVDLRRLLLAWLIANGRLELRFAFPEHVENPGIFHSKIGVFEFPWGTRVAFQGSANETAGGYRRNHETVDVYRDWIEGEAERVEDKSEEFREAWNGTAEGLRIEKLSSETLARVQEFAPAEFPRGSKSGTKPSGNTDKWRHQDEAIARFLKAERGVLEMATGTGKTRTSLRICQELLGKGLIDSIVVATDGTDLLDQWYLSLQQMNRELEEASKLTIVRHYSTHHEIDLYVADPEEMILLTSRKAMAPALRSLSTERGRRTLLIHDEVHGLGSSANRENLSGLSDVVRYRLGLSATPDREYDQDGNDFIREHIGDVIFEFDLGDAIRRRVLSPFKYFPLPYEPNQEDKERREKVYAKQAVRKREGNPMTQEELWIELSRVYKLSRAKIPVFEDFIDKQKDLLERCIIFVETREYGEEVLEIIHRHRPDFHTYYSADDSKTLRRFAAGELECLLTCHRLSQGIDIQSLKTVILFSSAKARLETIQRIGRCLRSDPEDPEKRANVVDFIRAHGVDGEVQENNPDEQRRDWLRSLAEIEPEGEAWP